MNENQSPPLRLKLFGWFILTLLSACIAEIPAGSSPRILFQVWGWMVTIPLYGLHLLLLATLVCWLGRPTLYALFFAGSIFGLYEAYITKVIWTPTWDAHPWRLGGVGVSTSIMLTLWWHNWMAFILPLMTGEVLLSRSRETLDGLPARVRGWLFQENGQVRTKRLMRCLIVSGALCGLFVAGSPELPRLGGLVIALQGMIVLGLIWLWRAGLGGARYTLRELLPGPTGFTIILIIVTLGYLFLGVKLRPEALPNIHTPSGRQAHYTVWMLYAFFGALLWLCLRRTRREPAPAETDRIHEASSKKSTMPWRLTLAWLGAFSGTALVLQPILNFLGNFKVIFMLLGWLVGGLLGVFMLVHGVRYALGRPAITISRGAVGDQGAPS